MSGARRTQPKGIGVKTSLLLMVALAFSPAMAGVDGGPDPENSTVTMAWDGPVMLRVHPDGSGPAFTEAYSMTNQRVDATITLTLRDYGGFPIANFPAEDIWLQSGEAGLQPCGGRSGAQPDRDTDANGQTVWVAPPRAGGWTSGLIQVYVNGMALATTAGLDIRFNSPDIDGDGRVNLTDGGMFSHDLFGAYAVRSDLNFDHVINISDAGQLRSTLGLGCP